MRNLASIQIVKEINPIEGADTIEVATVLGWKVVVKKGQFSVGSKVVYCEIDSLMPENSDFEFLKPRGMRVKTVRLRGQVSQGICFPLSIVEGYGLLPEDMIDGQDVTGALGIVKYDPPIPANLAGKVKGHFPAFIPKTDETRVQVLQSVLDKYKGAECYVTEKLDGSSVTYFLANGEFGVCSRNLELLENYDNTLWKIAKELDIENKLRSRGISCAVQGEVIGEGIQKNKYKLKGQTVKLFNFFDIDKFQYAGYADFYKVMNEIGLKDNCVPLLNDNYLLSDSIEELVKYSTMKSVLNPDSWAEGIVIRPINETIDGVISNGLLHADRVSLKAINPEFLLKYGE